MKKIAFICVLVLPLAGCIRNKPAPRDTKVGYPGDHNKVTLKGIWRSRAIEASYPDWREIAECFLYVYDGYSPENKVFEPRFLLAELVVKKSNGQTQLAYDSQPVMVTADRLCFGPIGSAYVFEYRVLAETLDLNLRPEDPGYLRIRFVRAGTDPGELRFPEVSGRWRSTEELE